MSYNATVYAAAPLAEVEPLLGDLSQYAEVADDNDGYSDYSSLIEIETLDAAQTLADAESVARLLARHDIKVAIATYGDPVPYEAPGQRDEG